MNHVRRRRLIAVFMLLVAGFFALLLDPESYDTVSNPAPIMQHEPMGDIAVLGDATQALTQIVIKGRAPKSGYERSEFGNGWASRGICDMRNLILERDMADVVRDDECRVTSGTLLDPYTGQTIHFIRGPDSSNKIQIDHVVALSDAWQKGAQNITYEQRVEFANDPLNLLAVDGPANQQKGDGDAATWLPPNQIFRCQYVARQIAVKQKYSLWVTEPEYNAMRQVLSRCPEQPLPSISK